MKHSILRALSVEKPLTNSELEAISKEISQLNEEVDDENISDDALERALDRLDMLTVYLENSIKNTERYLKLQEFKSRGLRLVV